MLRTDNDDHFENQSVDRQKSIHPFKEIKICIIPSVHAIYLY